MRRKAASFLIAVGAAAVLFWAIAGGPDWLSIVAACSLSAGWLLGMLSLSPLEVPDIGVGTLADSSASERVQQEEDWEEIRERCVKP